MTIHLTRITAVFLALGISITLFVITPVRLDGQRYLGMTWRDIFSIDNEMIYVGAKDLAYKQHRGLWTNTLQVNFSDIDGEQRVSSATSKRQIWLFDTTWIGDELSITKHTTTHYLEVWLLGRNPMR